MARTPPPAYVIESGDIARDGKGVFELAREEIRGFTHLHYSKYYETNPVGGPIFVVARDASSGTIVGTAALHPAEFVVGGNAHLGCVAGDFAVASRQRVFGPALALQRALTAQAEACGFSFSLGLPGNDAGGILARVGYRELAPGTRQARLLDTREALDALRRHGGPARQLGHTLRPWRTRRALRGYTAEPVAEFDESFAAVWEAMELRTPLGTRRTAVILNWKFERRHASGRFALLAVRRSDGAVAAYAVSYDADGVRHLAELAWLDRGALRAVLAAEIERGRLDGLSALDLLQFGADAELAAALEEVGFFATPAIAMTALPLGEAPAGLCGCLFFEGAIDL